MTVQGGSAFVLAALTPRSASASGATQLIEGWRRAIFLLSVTASATEAGDTLDVYIDVSPDGGTTWVNAGHFAQQAGNGAAKKEIVVLDTANPGTSSIAVTSDAAAGAVRPAVWGNAIRARWAIADVAVLGNHSHTFSVIGYVW